MLRKILGCVRFLTDLLQGLAQDVDGLLPSLEEGPYAKRFQINPQFIMFGRISLAPMEFIL